MVTKVIGDWTEEMALKALITNPTFIGEIGIGSVNISETELGLLEGAIEGANKLQIGDILIQWGTTPNLSGGEASVTFPIAYTSTPAVITSLIFVDVIAQRSYNTHLEVVSITAFTVQARQIIDSGTGATDLSDINSIGVSWLAIGINTA